MDKLIMVVVERMRREGWHMGHLVVMIVWEDEGGGR